MNVDAEFLFDAGANRRGKGDDIFGRSVIRIDDDKRLFGPHLRTAKRLTFPSALFNKPCSRDFLAFGNEIVMLIPLR